MALAKAGEPISSCWAARSSLSTLEPADSRFTRPEESNLLGEKGARHGEDGAAEEK